MISFTLNGQGKTFDGDPDTPLLWVIRDFAKLTGTKYGCGVAQCGACTVHMDGAPRRSCVTPVTMAEGSDIVTIEGLSGKEATAVQAAWIAIDVPQCGYCQSGTDHVGGGAPAAQSRSRPMTTSTAPWPAISAAAPPITGSAGRSMTHRR